VILLAAIPVGGSQPGLTVSQNWQISAAIDVDQTF